MKRLKYMLLAAVAVTATSCGENFFSLEPNDEVTTDKIYKTQSDFDIAVHGCYAKLQTQVNFYLELCEYRSDNLFLSAPTSGTQDRYDIDQFQEKASNGILEDYWANFNNGVYRCNLVLDKIDQADFDATMKAQFKAEAMFIRALTYFNMYRIWGGVPTTRTVLSPAQALKVKRGSAEEMYELIAGDLKAIIDNQMLPDSYASKNVGRATLGAAQALLGKVYLTFGKYTEAAAILEKVKGKYELLPNPLSVFDVANKMNNEVIFAVRFNKGVVNEGHGAWYSVTNLTDDSGQSTILKNLYTTDDLRKPLIEYVKVTGVNLYLMRKFYDTPDATNNTYGNDQILIRYADVLLMYAEALNELGYDASPTSPALAALNEVHMRAGLTRLTATDLPDKATFRKAVLAERQKEFPYEGQRWFDLVRMGYAKTEMAVQGYTLQDYQLLYPIPTTEMERINNTSLLWQNPGY